MAAATAGNGRSVKAPVAPGIIKQVFVKNQRTMDVGEEIGVTFVPSILALDGEREVEVRREQRVSVRLAKDGPAVVDVPRTMAAAMKRGILASK